MLFRSKAAVAKGVAALKDSAAAHVAVALADGLVADVAAAQALAQGVVAAVADTIYLFRETKPSAPKPGAPAAADLPPIQLYNLASDIGETRNVQADHPDVVARLTKLLEKYVADGRSTPGAPQQNTTPVSLQPKVGAVNAKGKAAAAE